MPAYAILDLEVFDKEKFKEYQHIAPEIIKKYGGKIVVLGGESIIQEGEWTPNRIVVVEFPSYEIAKDWSNSEEYQQAIELRKKGSQNQCHHCEWSLKTENKKSAKNTRHSNCFECLVFC